MAYIDSVTPNPATEGQLVKFDGHGTDADGNVVAYSWTSSIDGEIGTTDRFTTSVLSPGSHTISFRVQDNDSVWSDIVTVQLTVEGQIGEEMSMEDAIDVVVEDILPGIPEVAAGDPYWCIRLDSILPEGTVIEEDSGHTLKITLQEDMFFFFLDLAPRAMYAHPVKYILVNEGGKHKEYDARWWPRIDDDVPEELVKTVPDPAYAIATNIRLTAPTGTAMKFDLTPIEAKQPEGFIVVSGYYVGPWGDPDETTTYWNVYNFFDEYKSKYSRLVGLAEAGAEDSRYLFDNIDEMADEGLSPITIYINAPAERYHVLEPYVRIDRYPLLEITPSQLRSKVEEHPDTTFNFILDFSYSAIFIPELRAASNVCVVATSSGHDELGCWDVDHSSYFLWIPVGEPTDVNHEDLGAEWTSSLVEAMFIIVWDSAKMNVIKNMAGYYDVPVTCMLICQARFGALGLLPELGLNVNYDLCNIHGWSTPSGYCSFETLD